MHGLGGLISESAEEHPPWPLAPRRHVEDRGHVDVHQVEIGHLAGSGPRGHGGEPAGLFEAKLAQSSPGVLGRIEHGDPGRAHPAGGRPPWGRAAELSRGGQDLVRFVLAGPEELRTCGQPPGEAAVDERQSQLVEELGGFDQLGVVVRR